MVMIYTISCVMKWNDEIYIHIAIAIYNLCKCITMGLSYVVLYTQSQIICLVGKSNFDRFFAHLSLLHCRPILNGPKASL